MSEILERTYKLYEAGLSYKEIAQTLGICDKTVNTRIYHYRQKHGIPARKLVPKPQAKKTRYTLKTHGPKWHKLHCGKGKTSEDIARAENCDVDKVRKILQQYREKMWGCA